VIEPGGLLAVCRLLFDAGALILWGAGAYTAAFMRPPLRDEIWQRFSPVRRVAIIAVTLGFAASMPLQAAIIADGWNAAADPEILAAVAFTTSIGTAWLWQAAAIVILLIAQAPALTGRIVPTTIAALLLLASLPISGHAAMHTGYLRLFHRGSDLVHLLAGGFWLGGLVPFLFILPRLRNDRYRSEAAKALIAFSRAGHVAVTLVILSGAANTWLIVQGLPLDWRFPYQALLSLKVALVATMMTIAIVNRYVFVPFLGRRKDALTALAIGSVTEIVIGLAAVGAVTCFGLLEPR
jgi:putative copper resistance protein D